MDVMPKRDLKNDMEDVMFFEGKTYTLTDAKRGYLHTIDEQDMKNYMSVDYIEENFKKISA